MGNFRSEGRSGGFRGGRDSGRSGGFGRSSGGFGGGRDRGRPEMHDVVCDKCGKDCQVPFKPSGDKPVLCSDCFRVSGDPRGDRRSSGGNFDGGSASASTGGMSQEQFKQINTKLDKIIEFLDQIEFEEEEELEGEEEIEDEIEEVKEKIEEKI